MGPVGHRIHMLWARSSHRQLVPQLWPQLPPQLPPQLQLQLQLQLQRQPQRRLELHERPRYRGRRRSLPCLPQRQRASPLRLRLPQRADLAEARRARGS
jgi:hypothetical protein